MSTYTVPATANYRDSITGAAKRFKLAEVIPIEEAVRFGMPGAALPADGPPFTDAQVDYIESSVESGAFEPSSSTAARTATADGLTTGLIADGTDFAQVTSANANHIITLPTPTPNTIVALRNGATGYELRSSSPTTVAINGGTGAAAESAVPANTRTICHCDTATTWLCHNTDTAGVVTASEVAAP